MKTFLWLGSRFVSSAWQPVSFRSSPADRERKWHLKVAKQGLELNLLNPTQNPLIPHVQFSLQRLIFSVFLSPLSICSPLVFRRPERCHSGNCDVYRCPGGGGGAGHLPHSPEPPAGGQAGGHGQRGGYDLERLGSDDHHQPNGGRWTKGMWRDAVRGGAEYTVDREANSW